MGFNHVQTATLFKILNDMTDCIIVKPNLGYKMDQWTERERELMNTGLLEFLK